jgi:hypothetical protein
MTEMTKAHVTRIETLIVRMILVSLQRFARRAVNVFGENIRAQDDSQIEKKHERNEDLHRFHNVMLIGNRVS